VTAWQGLVMASAMCTALSSALTGQPHSEANLRGAAGLVLAVSLSIALCGATTVAGLIHRKRRARWAIGDAGWPPPETPHSYAPRAAAGAIGLVLILLVCYHLAIGFDIHPLGRRTAALLLACTAGGGGAALLFLIERKWNVNLADIGMALISLAACCAAVAVLPTEPQSLDHRYPLIFNAVLFALALMSWLWCWLSCVWRQQLDGDVAWTTAGRMIEPAVRVSFFTAVAALVLAGLMTAWPRLSTVSTMDHSLGRIAAGTAGHLLLLWAILWSARRTRLASFIGLAVLSTISLVGFLYVRTGPLTSAAY